MAYTASLLSFMLEGLNKTVVLTGSQIPISELRNDAVDNLLGSLIVAGTFKIPEVCIYFCNKVLRGNRASKDNSSKLHAFDSPNMDPLATLDVNFVINWDRVLRMNPGSLVLHDKLETNIAFITMSPIMNIKALELVLSPQGGSKAVIIAGYGMGNLPSNNKELMSCIADAVARDVIVVIKTQCHRGTVNDLYETGRVLTKIGCVLAMDMTVECIFAKLAYLLGKGFSNSKVNRLMKTNLRGELTDKSKEKDKYTMRNNQMVMAVADYLKKDKNAQTSKQITPVLVNSLISIGNLSSLKKLHANGADLNAVDYLGRSALHVVCNQNGNVKIA